MNTPRRILKNTVASFLTQLSSPVCSFLLIFFIARFLGTSGLGQYATVMSLYYICQTISSLGFPYLITREVAQDKSKVSQYLMNAVIVGFPISILTGGIMCLAINIITDIVDTVHAVYVLSIALLPYTLSLVSQSICRAFEKLEYITISQVTGNLFKLLAGIFMLFRGYGLVNLMLITSISQFIICFFSLCLALRFVKRPLKTFNFDFCKRIVRGTTIFTLILIFSSIRYNIDILILSKMLRPIEVGFYGAAIKSVNICKFAFTCYIMAVQPIIFRMYKTSIGQFEIVCKQSIKYLSIIIFPIIFGTVILADKFILLIFKHDFLPSAGALSILIWLLLLNAFNILLANSLIASNNQRLNLQANIIGMIANVCLNLLLIPLLDFIGAAYANVSSAFIVLVYQYYFVSKYLFVVDFYYFVKKPIISATLMAIFILLFRQMNLFLLIPTSGILYGLMLVILKTFSSSDIDILKKLYKKEKALTVLQERP